MRAEPRKSWILLCCFVAFRLIEVNFLHGSFFLTKAFSYLLAVPEMHRVAGIRRQGDVK